MRKTLLFLLLSSALSFGQQTPDSLNQLASDFWAWRATYRPFTFDDITRMERPGGVRDWSGSSIGKQRRDLAEFEHRWDAMSTADSPLVQKIDYRLMGAAIARVRWELDVNPRWQRDPTFYVEQTVVAIQEELLPPPPFDEARSREIVTRVENLPSILEQAQTNLKAIAPFAKLAINSISDIESRFSTVEEGVSPLLTSDELRAHLHIAILKAVKALVEIGNG